MKQGRVGPPACLHIVNGPFMIPFLRNHRTDQGRMVHDLCGLLERVSDQRITQRRLDRLGRSADSGIRVWIEGFKLAGATLEP